MAVVACIKCNKEISKLAVACPSCGVPISAKTKPEPERIQRSGKFLEIVGYIAVVIGFTAMSIGENVTGSVFLGFGFIAFLIGRFS